MREASNVEDMEIIDNPNTPQREVNDTFNRIDERQMEIDSLSVENRRIEERLSICERFRNLREKLKYFFKKNGVTIGTIAVATGITLGIVLSTLGNSLAKVAKGVGNGLKEIGKKLGQLLPGLIGSIASFILSSRQRGKL